MSQTVLMQDTKTAADRMGHVRKLPCYIRGVGVKIQFFTSGQEVRIFKQSGTLRSGSSTTLTCITQRRTKGRLVHAGGNSLMLTAAEICSPGNNYADLRCVWLLHYNAKTQTPDSSLWTCIPSSVWNFQSCPVCDNQRQKHEFNTSRLRNSQQIRNYGVSCQSFTGLSKETKTINHVTVDRV